MSFNEIPSVDSLPELGLENPEAAELLLMELGKHFNPVLRWATPVRWRQNFAIANPDITVSDDQLKLPIV